jgi:Do/DeqQ family serine protease
MFMNKSPLDESDPKSQISVKPSLSKPITYLSLILLGSGITAFGNYFISQKFSSPLVTKAQATTPQGAIAKGASEAIAKGAREAIAAAPIPGINNPNFVTNVVQQVGPAVVRIDSSRTVESQLPDEFNDPFFRRFFGDAPVPDKQVQKGSGSGFILNVDGRILTNAHVVEGADSVTVILKDGRKFKGKVLGSDRVTDVAVVKIDAQNLPTVKLGNSEQLQPGEWAIAIGNPLGLDNSVTMGIISATGRSSSQVGVPDKRVNFIQTDAAINPGNSGGPLLNHNGEVIGMNTAIIQGAQGLGFAIPINRAQQIAEQLSTKGKVEHPFLGIQMIALTPEVKQEINSNPNSGLSIREDKGVLIVKVVPNSPAAKAGLRAGDVIDKINTQEVKDANSVQQIVESSQVGNTLQVGVKRQGQSLNLGVQAGSFPNKN